MKILLLYHYLWAFLSAVIYRFPSRELTVIGVTGTKGKTTTVELVSAVLEAAGFVTAISSSLRFKIAGRSEPNLLKMTMPGRFFLQRFLRRAVRSNCRFALIEMTSEGARQFRHRFIDLDYLIFTNLAPEHIESHGSYEKYREAKLDIAKQLERSAKPQTTIIVNADDKGAEQFLNIQAQRKIRYFPSRPAPELAALRLPGEFNRANALAAITLAKVLNIPNDTIVAALAGFRGIRGRLEEVISEPIKVIVDYAHTPDSLRQVYQIFADRRLICVLGSCGGGRDKWKRPVMGQIAAQHCFRVILTDEDPYDEDPKKIVAEIARGIMKENCQIIVDRRLAIQEALRQAQPGEVVIITGKGTDPYIMGPGGSKIPWDDATVVREEMKKISG